jgi:hypothetical protein
MRCVDVHDAAIERHEFVVMRRFRQIGGTIARDAHLSGLIEVHS